jgi:hypothetical protein
MTQLVRTSTAPADPPVPIAHWDRWLRPWPVVMLGRGPGGLPPLATNPPPQSNFAGTRST